MRVLHFADLHLGKRVNDFSMLENQRHILKEIIAIINLKKVEAVIIAGDIYDKSIPSNEAIELFDWFINELNFLKLKVFIIAGNHDGAKRLSFGYKLIDKSDIFIRGSYQKLEAISILDYDLKINFYLLPFSKPSDLRMVYPFKKIESYQDMMQVILDEVVLNPKDFNILITHHFISGSELAGSEMMSVGDLSDIDVKLFKRFDYVALGHIHKAQKVAFKHIRYSGSILKYSLKEVFHQKSVTLIDIKQDKSIEIEKINLKPLQDMIYFQAYFEELKKKSFYKHLKLDDFYIFELKDDKPIPFALENLRTIYPNIMSLTYLKNHLKNDVIINEFQAKGVFEMIADFYFLKFNQPMNNQEANYLKKILGVLEDET